MNIFQSDEFRLHSQVMSDLKAKLGNISQVLGDGSKIVYIDYPAHYNVGDLLINLGTESFFSTHSINVVSRYAIGDLGKYRIESDIFEVGRRIIDLDKDIDDGAVIVLHGGGSFGDLWPHHQRMREALLERYRGIKVIVFPQSIHFQSEKKLLQAARIFRDHGNVTIYVRDEESLLFVNEHAGVPGEVLPDMAHYLWNDSSFFPFDYCKGAGTLSQTRIDSEGNMSSSSKKSFDWDDIISGRDKLECLLFSVWRRTNPFLRTLPSYRMWYRIRDRVIHKGVEHFQAYENVHTDRLHGLILSTLLSKRIDFDDRENKYRKLHRYYQKWLADSPLITAA